MQSENIDLKRLNSELQERSNRLDTDLVKEKDKLKEHQQKLEESENSKKRTERQKES